MGGGHKADMHMRKGTLILEAFIKRAITTVNAWQNIGNYDGKQKNS